MMGIENKANEELEDIKRKIMENVSNLECHGSLQSSINASLEFTKNNPSTLLKGETKSVNHLIYEMNEFYINMMERLKELRHETGEDADDDENIPDDGSLLSEVTNAINKRRNEPAIKKAIDKILNLEGKLQENYEILKNERIERKSVQDELVEMLCDEETPNKKSQLFLDLCRMEQECRKRAKHEAAKQDNPECAAVKKVVEEKENKFILRNKLLAKNSVMANCSLTDEEKIKLEQLLNESCDNPLGNEEEVELLSHCGFLYNTDDRERLRELESKLQELAGISSSCSLLTSVASEVYEQIEQDEKDGKYWKHEDRLKQIEESLKLLQLEKDNENTLENESTFTDEDYLKCISSFNLNYEEEDTEDGNN